MTAIADSLAGEHWTLTRLSDKRPVDRMSEPSWYIDPDGVVHLLFRDQNRSNLLHRSVSYGTNKEDIEVTQFSMDDLP